MLTHIWNRFSYIIILFVLAIVSSVYFLIVMGSQPSYQSITVQHGDTLWTIANQYNEEYSMTVEEFISWVGEENNLTSFSIKPGESLILPIQNPKLSTHSDNQFVMNQE
ncbi:LysM peptidoglycan-binding domain-containing protein (plasmid) [Cytobacillus spongiae]|uniref:cell division suppressor protein YneA n=1 Tax=Cytobacillus spongiae TaxID=2901381 RepID=UPI00145F8CD1|nr:LysM peptidoglycan-binding domain-containing protein [Cytobacillus spongiae]MCA1062500.1 LysM peptidoglycan-binding domain-containing protein [Rossellomorea aquimaris]NMH71057.1 LysM peptidoglycan-binding domain-containing protein [Bacillus sp. RO3]UII58138.1 LysM peptidoglycan-binding domain-containing protein [Cytobacillus spongiae]WJV28813.1 LysM peptidoglycan-binding domain-containing protein [Rossellomorea sp. AcN35-11]